jgi:hypothetical protein
MIVSEVSYGSPESATGGGTTGLLPVATTMLSAVIVAPLTSNVRGPVNRAWPV